jgi:hypothetical protein
MRTISFSRIMGIGTFCIEWRTGRFGMASLPTLPMLGCSQQEVEDLEATIPMHGSGMFQIRFDDLEGTG